MTNIGIIREGRLPADRRTPLSPAQCKALKNIFLDINIFVQPSPHRCFTDEEYAAEGFTLQEDMSHCDILLGIKEVPVNLLIPHKIYLFFSHTIKKQSHNRPLLQAILRKNITLVDYETLTDNKGERLIAFGHYAGLVGAYNALWACGKRFGWYDLKRAYLCFDKAEVFSELAKIKLPPIKMAVTGGGRVANGAMELLDKAGIKKVSAENLLQKTDFQEPVYAQLRSSDYHQAKDGKIADATDFYKNPQDYESTFARFAQRIDLLVACAYWNPQAPKLFTINQMQQPDFNIKIIADITCDIDGSIPSTQRASTILEPLYDINPSTQSIESQFSRENNVTVMAIDNLPTELPRDASTDFGKLLIEKILPYLLGKDEESIIARATIAEAGKLTKQFAYLQDFVTAEDVAPQVLERS